MKYLLALIFASFALTTQATGAEINLIWNAETYTPPFFLGHSAATPGSSVRVAALAPGAGATSQLQFRWWRNGQFLTQASGTGRDVLTFTADDNGESTITLRLNNTSGELLAEKTLTIPASQPRLVIYENNPLTGISYSQAIGTGLTLAKPELALLAEPYYFSRADVANKKLNYAWQLNSQKLTTSADDGRAVTFGLPSEGGAGENTVTLSAESLSNLLQAAKRTFIIKFGGSSFNF
ncbi:MAG: hypothetical protein AAB364_02935 [Patescibacteria group bacterium]